MSRKKQYTEYCSKNCYITVTGFNPEKLFCVKSDFLRRCWGLYRQYLDGKSYSVFQDGIGLRSFDFCSSCFVQVHLHLAAEEPMSPANMIL